MDLKINKEAKISAEDKAKIESYLDEKLEAIIDTSSKKYFSFFFKDLLFTSDVNIFSSETTDCRILLRLFIMSFWFVLQGRLPFSVSIGFWRTLSLGFVPGHRQVHHLRQVP